MQTRQCGLNAPAPAVKPNYVETKIYSSLHSTTPIITRTYFDGASKNIETQAKLNTVKSKMLVSGTFPLWPRHLWRIPICLF